MDPAIHEKRPRTMLRLATDTAVLAGLVLAVVAVVAFDRDESIDGPKAIEAVDLVFILDQRSTMKDLIDAMKANCLERAEGLIADGLDCRFAVVPFGQKRNRLPNVPFTAGMEEFKRRFLVSPEAVGVAAAA